MSVLISGVLTDGTGLPMSGYHIILKARQNTPAVVMRTVATVVTGPAGEYVFEAQTGRYDVYLRSCIEREYCVGDISVYDDSKPGTLNDFLTALDEGDLKPDVVKRFEEMVAQAQQSAEAAAESERQAGQHAEAAALIKEQVETLADNVQQNTNAVEENTQRVEQLASQVEDTAEEVRQNAEAAKQAASDAEQARDDIDVALSATLKTANHLSEIAAEGEDAQQESRDNLGLKSAATMDVQTDIYNRTEGCVALPGAFGYGMTKSGGNSIVASDMTTVARTAHNVHPGRYYTVSSGTEETTGITEIIWLDNNWGDKTSQTATKLVLFFGKDGRILMTIRGDDIYAPVTWTNLTPQLGSAAQKDVQEDIYDRTEGRLAIPGAFGYGAIFRSSKSFSSENGPTEFLEWVKNTNPGQYAVTQYGSVNRYNPIIKGVVFTGIVDIKIPDTVASNASPDNKGKVVTFYGVNGEIYYNRLAGSQFSGWVKLNLKGVDFADILSARTAPTSLGDPDVGGLILAAYQGTADGDTNISMTRGYAYPGSSLTPLSIAIPSDRENVATATPLITTRGCRGWSLPGAYIALNGAAGNVRGDSALVGLFVRAA
ncbi:prophage tail fiber N-terminal domain-containing protein [Escherichia coli]|nr:phage tail protein [Escherichia coli]HBA7778734.1 phage tail protein [Escherichia coli]HBA9745997.1 phage tail protein [Escherichia coli]